MEAKHTPGPWFNTSQDDTPMGEVMDQPLDSGVTMHVSVSGPNAKADARLIAAAPDLLEALQALLILAQQEIADPEDCHEVQAAIAIISKAKGQS